MKNLQITNSRFITYTDDLLTVDVLGGVDLSQVERMVCTLRITYNDYPPQRTTLIYTMTTKTDKLQRTLCDKWGLKLLEASRSLYTLTLQLEEYRLQQLRYTGKSPQQAFSPERGRQTQSGTFSFGKEPVGQSDGATEHHRHFWVKTVTPLSCSWRWRRTSRPIPFRFCVWQNRVSVKVISCKKLSECMPDVFVLVPQPYIGKRPVLLRQRGY